MFRRVLFEPRPVEGDVQWLDFDPEEGALIGGSFGASDAITMVGFTETDNLEDDEVTVLCADCTLSGDDEEVGQAVGMYLVVLVGETPMMSPTKVATVQTIYIQEEDLG